MPLSDSRTRESWWRRTTALGLRHRAVVGVCLVVGLVVGGLTAVLSPPTYEAESKLLVGTFEAPAAAIPGYILASQTVAGDYARLAGSAAVLNKIPDDGPLTPDQVASMVTVTAVPESAIVRIVATSGNEDDARVAADAMSQAIVTYVDDTNAPAAANESLLGQLRDAADRLESAKIVEEDAQRAATAAPSDAGLRTAFGTATANVTTIQAEVDGLQTRYQTQNAAASTSSEVRPLGEATVTEQSKLLITLLYVVVGLLIGLVVGLLVALLRERAHPATAAPDVSPNGSGPNGSSRHERRTAGAGA